MPTRDLDKLGTYSTSSSTSSSDWASTAWASSAALRAASSSVLRGVASKMSRDELLKIKTLKLAVWACPPEPAKVVLVHTELTLSRSCKQVLVALVGERVWQARVPRAPCKYHVGNWSNRCLDWTCSKFSRHPMCMQVLRTKRFLGEATFLSVPHAWVQRKQKVWVLVLSRCIVRTSCMSTTKT